MKTAVTTNLAAALLEAQQYSFEDGAPILLFVDAISINQDDEEERGSQVQLMDRVFGSATIVLSWYASETARVAFETIEYLYKALGCISSHKQMTSDIADWDTILRFDWMRLRPNLCQAQVNEPASKYLGGIQNEYWKAVAAFLQDRYFHRVWIVQEVVLAASCVFYGPGCTLGWPTLSLMIWRLGDLRHKLDELGMEKPEFIHSAIWLAINSEAHLPCKRVVELAYLKIRQFDSTSDHSLDGAHLYMALNGRQASNPKDFRYGLLGLTKLPIIPNYGSNHSMSDLYCEYIPLFLTAGDHEAARVPLYFLSNAGTGHFGAKVDIPSWAPNFATSAAYSRTITGLDMPGPLWTNCVQQSRPYIQKDTRSLFVWGASIDAIAFISNVLDPSTRSNKDVFELVRDVCSGKTNYNQKTPPLQAIFRLFFFDLNFKVDKRTITKALALVRWLVECAENVDVSQTLHELQLLRNTHASTAEQDIQPSFQNSFNERFCPGFDLSALEFKCTTSMIFTEPTPEARTRYLSCILELYSISGWRYCETQAGFMGFAPVGARVGDLICILKDSEVPVILRASPNNSYFTFVSTAFIVDMMNGEMSAFMNSEEAQRHWFELR